LSSGVCSGVHLILRGPCTRSMSDPKGRAQTPMSSPSGKGNLAHQREWAEDLKPRWEPWIPKAFAGWLGDAAWMWTHWHTATFRLSGGSHHAAIRAWTKIWAATQDHTRSAAFVCTEQGKMFGRVHIHALIRAAVVDHAECLDEQAGARLGWAMTRDYRDTGGAADYCAKYVTKAMGLWDVHHPVTDPSRRGDAWFRRAVARWRPSYSQCCSGCGCSVPGGTYQHRKSYRPAVPLDSKRFCLSGGVEVIERGSPTNRRHPTDLSTLLTAVVSVGPSTSGMAASGLRSSPETQKRPFQLSSGAAAGSHLITTISSGKTNSGS